jgi:hypothetical protein
MGQSKQFGAKSPAIPHLVRGSGGLAGEIKDLREDIDETFAEQEAGGGYLRTDEFIDAPAADADYLMTARASLLTTVDVWDKDSAEATAAWQNEDEMVPPRNLLVAGNGNADITAATLTVTGYIRDDAGNLVAQTEDIAIPNNLGAAGVQSTKPFSLVTSASMSADHAGINGTFTLGFGDAIGLSALVKERAGLIAPLREVSGGAVVTTGVVTNPVDSAVSLYTPNAVPDGAVDYAVTYEVG